MKQPSEHEEAVVFAETLELLKVDFWHIPQETYTPSWNQKRKNKAEGVKKGVSDYLIYLPPARCKNKKGGLVWIELKKQRTRKKSGEFRALSSDGITIYPEQEDFIAKMKTIGNVDGSICFGADEAIAKIKRVLT